MPLLLVPALSLAPQTRTQTIPLPQKAKKSTQACLVSITKIANLFSRVLNYSDPLLAPSALVDPTKVSSRHIPHSKPRPRRLWHSHEIPTSLEGRSSRTTSRRRSSSKDQENTAPTPPQIYRPPKQRFGIFLTGKSSTNTTCKDWTGPPAH